MIAKVCDRESRRDSWFENRLVIQICCNERRRKAYEMFTSYAFCVGCSPLQVHEVYLSHEQEKVGKSQDLAINVVRMNRKHVVCCQS